MIILKRKEIGDGPSLDVFIAKNASYPHQGFRSESTFMEFLDPYLKSYFLGPESGYRSAI